MLQSYLNVALWFLFQSFVIIFRRNLGTFRHKIVTRHLFISDKNLIVNDPVLIYTFYLRNTFGFSIFIVVLLIYTVVQLCFVDYDYLLGTLRHKCANKCPHKTHSTMNTGKVMCAGVLVTFYFLELCKWWSSRHNSTQALLPLLHAMQVHKVHLTHLEWCSAVELKNSQNFTVINRISHGVRNTHKLASLTEFNCKRRMSKLWFRYSL